MKHNRTSISVAVRIFILTLEKPAQLARLLALTDSKRRTHG